MLGFMLALPTVIVSGSLGERGQLPPGLRRGEAVNGPCLTNTARITRVAVRSCEFSCGFLQDVIRLTLRMHVETAPRGDYVSLNVCLLSLC